MAYLFFLSSCVSAFSLCILVFVLLTGDLPFGIQPMLPTPARTAPAVVAETVTQPSLPREVEAYASDVLASLERQQERISAEREQLEHQRKAAEQASKHARELHRRLETQLETSVQLVDMIEANERNNIRSIASLVSSTDSKAGSQMLLAMEPARAARILYYMEERNAAGLITQMIKADPANSRFTADVAREMQRLSDDDALQSEMKKAIGRTP